MRSASLLLVLSLAACSKEKPTPAPATDPPTQGTTPKVSETQRARAAALVGELKKSLLTAVSGALGQGAPAAIEMCHAAAPSLTEAVSREGAIVGRATRKPRNGANEATGWQADALAYFENLHANKQPLAGQSFAKILDGGRVAYAEPLVIQELCLTCHGQTLAPEVQNALAAKYPNDRATGYELGDLRGVAWAELPASQPER